MNERKDYILGVDLGGTNIKAAAYRLDSYEKVGEKRLPTQVEGGWERLLGPARRVVESHALAISRAGCEIVTAQLGDAAGMLGAAVYGARRTGEGARM